MSLWRAKRRQTINRRFRERADDALLAINTLEAKADDLDLEVASEDTRHRLHKGVDLLTELRAAVESPANADDHHYALAQALINRWEVLDDRASHRLADDIHTLERAADEIAYNESLDSAKETLEAIEHISSQASKREESRLRQHFAN